MRCAVLGDPIGHSLSPVLHRAAYAELGLDWTYDAVKVASGELGEFLANLGDDVRGLSLTMPLKREVMSLVHDLSDRAELVGAANTLVLDEGRISADNTDLPGAMAALRERYDGPVTSATILGAGATAASTGLAMADLGATSIRVMARSRARADQTRRAIAYHPSRPEVTVVNAATESATGDLLVTTIPADAQTPDLVERCLDVPVLFEVLYDPWPTPLVSAFGATGGVVVGGLDLLIHQAALQIGLFTGTAGPLDVMRAAGERALAGRSR